MDKENEKYVTWGVHHEFERRMAEENDRQNHRIEKLEENVEQIGKLTVSVEKMAVSTESMAKELNRQGSRLDEIEKKPAKNWETLVGGVLGALAGAIGGFIASGFIH